MGMLRKDSAALPGLVLTAVLSQTAWVGAKKHTTHLKLSTQSIREATLSARAFQIPTGFEIVSPESLTQNAKPEPKAASGSLAKEPSLLDKVSAVFFCAIASRLGCIGN